MKLKTIGVFFALTMTLEFANASETYQATTDINIRNGAGADYGIVGKIPQGDKVIIDNISSNWGEVMIDGESQGFVSMKYLTTESNKDHEEKNSTWEYIITISILIYAYYNRKKIWAKIRDSPDKVDNYFPSTKEAKQNQSVPINQVKQNVFTPIPTVKEVKENVSKPETQKVFCSYCGYDATNIRNLTAQNCRKNPNGKYHVPYDGSLKSKYSCKYCGYTATNIRNLTAQPCRKNPSGEYHIPAL